MKPIQIMIDEGLLARLDADEEVRRDGRSAFLRRAVRERLRKQAARRISEQYRQAYASKEALGLEFAGWEGEGKWPEK